MTTWVHSLHLKNLVFFLDFFYFLFLILLFVECLHHRKEIARKNTIDAQEKLNAEILKNGGKEGGTSHH
jgi:hypothetical protein